MRHHLIAGVVTTVGLLSTAVPAMAQAKGSAEASPERVFERVNGEDRGR